uniref:Putative 6.8 kDa acidic salivary peptide n=1 Tax=Culex quinquefasciatus TaxID=7176 RepID=Q6TS16_CULQU|nr:putative 6.8 kDa acidic salivary peptide [Culex quinquefasciatus]
MKIIATVCFVLLISQTIVLKFGSAIPVTAISIGNASSITELFGNKTSDQEQEIVGLSANNTSAILSFLNYCYNFDYNYNYFNYW